MIEALKGSTQFSDVKVCMRGLAAVSLHARDEMMKMRERFHRYLSVFTLGYFFTRVVFSTFCVSLGPNNGTITFYATS